MGYYGKHTSHSSMTGTLFLFLVMLFVMPCRTGAQTANEVLPIPDVHKIMNHIYTHAPAYRDTVQEYQAGMYVRAFLNIRKKNFLFRYIPKILHSEKGIQEYVLESYRDIHYTAPGIYDQKVKYVTGTLRNQKHIPGIIHYFRINIYDPYLIGDALLSPLTKSSRHHYTYRVVSSSCNTETGVIEYLIAFTPKNKSYQLLEGEFTVNATNWSVRTFTCKGRSELLRFRCRMEMGQQGSSTEFLPLKYDIEASYVMAWNRIDGRYQATLNYKDIRQKSALSDKKKKNYNLSASFRLRCDSTALKQDFRAFDTLRTIPLASYEKVLYQDYRNRKDSLRRAPKTPHKKEIWDHLNNLFLEDYQWNQERFGHLRFSPVLNPLLFSYSKGNGLAYRQDLRYNKALCHDRLLEMNTRLGYNFTQKQFYWKYFTGFQYNSRHLGRVTFQIGNGNRIYSSDVLDEIKDMADTTLNFDFLNLNYFKDLNAELQNEIEIVNGLTLHTGIIVHRRRPVKGPDLPDSSLIHQIPGYDTTTNHKVIRKNYISVAPHIRLTWTPGQYYYLNGNKKHNLYSLYPTFILDYERGLRHVFKSTGVYERIELEMQHHIRLGVHTHLYYRAGCGAFTNQEETYFVDFAHLRKNNFPEGWSDDIGGVFQNLDGRWYNASSRYIRGNMVLEAPFLLLRHLGRYTGHVRNERIYLNLLNMNRLPIHLEVGYGINTFIFDTGIFLSYNQKDKWGVGYKFSFELFQ